MKQLIILSIFLVSFCSAQQRIQYSYDQSGNRKQRSYFLLRVKENLKDDLKDSTSFQVSGNNGRRFNMISPQASFRRKLEKRNFKVALTAK